MVKLMLSLKADLENVTDLQPAIDSFEYFFQVLGSIMALAVLLCSEPSLGKICFLYQVECSSCHEKHPKLVGLNRVVRRPGSLALYLVLTWHKYSTLPRTLLEFYVP